MDDRPQTMVLRSVNYRPPSCLYLNPLDLEWCYIGVDGFIEFSGCEMTGEDGLGDDVGRFGVADDTQGFESSVCEGGFEFVIERVVGDSVGDHDDGVAGESRFGVGEGLGHSGSCRGERGESMVGEQSHI